MASEIVKRLRAGTTTAPGCRSPTSDDVDKADVLMDEAADHIEALEVAAKAVIAQWDTPNWKLTEPTAKLIEALRALVPEQKEG